MKTFLFYDIETSGLNSAFDQILTFAAIRTDLHLNEINRENILIKLRPDIVPSPGAFITHRLLLDELKNGCCEYKAAKRIHEIMNTPGTISLGYNSLNFDDEFLRFTFYRNLLSPYTHQYANGCSRMDILPIALLYRLFRPEVLKWPEINGKPTMKLELISKKNNLVSPLAKAHDAMVDVEATLSLAKKLFKEKDMWDYCLGFFDKKEDQARTQRILETIQYESQHYRTGIMISLAFGSRLMYMAPVLLIGNSVPYSNQALWLRLDNENFLPKQTKQSNQTDPFNHMFVIRKRYGESEIILPPEKRFMNRLLKTQRIVCQKNLELIKTEPELFKELVQYHLNYEYPVIPDLDYDASLYQSGFFSWKEQKEIAMFHNASTDDKVKLSMAPDSPIKSQRIKALAFRILFRNYPDLTHPMLDIPLSMTDDAVKYIKKIKSSKHSDNIKGFRNDTKLTYDIAADTLHHIKEQNNLDKEQLAILDQLETLYTRIMKPIGV